MGAFSDGLRDFGAVMAAVFAYGMTGAAPCRPTRALCRRHTSIFLPRTASGRSACTLAAKLSNASRACGSDFGRAHRKAPKPERGKLPACRAFLHRHTQAPFGLALQTDAPPADNTVSFRTGACADARGKRGLPRRVEEWVTPRRRQAPQDLPRCSDRANPIAAGGPSRGLKMPTCGRGSPEPMRPPPYAARPWYHGSGSRQHGVPSTSNPSA